jgi:hypothetical protein
MAQSSELMGWTCRNGHYTARALSLDVCVACGAIRDPRELYGDAPMGGKGAEKLLDSFNPGIKDKTASERESGERKFRTSSLSDKRGFVCYRCAELFAQSQQTIEMDAKISGIEQPGTSIEVFQLREDLRWHIRNVHGGKAHPDKTLRDMRRKSEGKS